jgi:hypothetical protein
MELYADQGADGLAVLGSPWRIPLPMDLRRLPRGDGIHRRTAFRADSESVRRAYRWTPAGATVRVELIATGDRRRGASHPMDGGGAVLRRGR